MTISVASVSPTSSSSTGVLLPPPSSYTVIVIITIVIFKLSLIYTSMPSSTSAKTPTPTTRRPRVPRGKPLKRAIEQQDLHPPQASIHQSSQNFVLFRSVSTISLLLYILSVRFTSSSAAAAPSPPHFPHMAVRFVVVAPTAVLLLVLLKALGTATNATHTGTHPHVTAATVENIRVQLPRACGVVVDSVNIADELTVCLVLLGVSRHNAADNEKERKEKDAASVREATGGGHVDTTQHFVSLFRTRVDTITQLRVPERALRAISGTTPPTSARKRRGTRRAQGEVSDDARMMEDAHSSRREDVDSLNDDEHDFWAVQVVAYTSGVASPPALIYVDAYGAVKGRSASADLALVVRMRQGAVQRIHWKHTQHDISSIEESDAAARWRRIGSEALAGVSDGIAALAEKQHQQRVASSMETPSGDDIDTDNAIRSVDSAQIDDSDGSGMRISLAFVGTDRSDVVMNSAVAVKMIVDAAV